MTDINDDYEPYLDDGYYGDERADDEYYDPEPDFEALEHQRYASLSPSGRLRHDLRAWIRLRALRRRVKIGARNLRGHAATADEPPF